MRIFSNINKLSPHTGLVLLSIPLVAFALRTSAALYLYGQDVGDAHIFQLEADTILQGGQPYIDLTWDNANYPPFWIFCVTISLRVISLLSNLSFYFVLRLFTALIAVLYSIVGLLYSIFLQPSLNAVFWIVCVSWLTTQVVNI